jgi:DNA repair protein RecO (recombination protein O)
VPLYRDEAVVLRVHKLGEADRIVTLLTRRHGRVRAVGKGVRRTSSRFGARLEPGSHIDVQLYSRLPEGQASPDGRRALDVVQQTESIDPFGARLAGDYARWTAASVICETAERMTEEGEPALRLFLLVVGALRALVAGEHDPGLILDAFLIRAMAVAGWEPALLECAKCSRPGPHAAFNVPAGGRAAAWSRPTCSGTWSAACARCRWSTAHEAAARSRGITCPDDRARAVLDRCDPRAERSEATNDRTRPAPAGRCGLAGSARAPVRGPAAGDPGRARAAARGDRDGRQRPLGARAGAAAHRGAPGR